MTAESPTTILDSAFNDVSSNLDKVYVNDTQILAKVDLVCRNPQNRACSRFLLACLLTKIAHPNVDIRKPYTEIGDKDAYSGRTYDEAYISPFVIKHDLPCNSTTAFLTPAFRNRNIVLTPDVNLVGRPPSVYKAALELLDAVHIKEVDAEDLLKEIISHLLQVRKERLSRMTLMLDALKQAGDTTILSAEAIVNLIEQHLKSPNSSRLPVLIVAAAYKSAENNLAEKVLPLYSHNAADKQTGALGDIQITLIDDKRVITCYEMKTKRVTQGDIDNALQKIVSGDDRIDNYIIITTEPIEQLTTDYAKTMYEKTGGIEVVVLDCVNFLRHFLHLFHRLRSAFLNEYQKYLLREPDSAVRQELKEAFLVLRKASETLG